MKSHVERIEAARKTLEELKIKQSRAMALLERDRADAEAAKLEAVQLFGTADLNKLRELRSTYLKQNEQMTIEFERQINEIAERQSLVDKKLMEIGV